MGMCGNSFTALPAASITTPISTIPNCDSQKAAVMAAVGAPRDLQMKVRRKEGRKIIRLLLLPSFHFSVLN